MPCTTILIGKGASYDGSTIVARNEDSPNGMFQPKRLCVVAPEEQPRVYIATTSKLTIELPDNPLRYTAVPDAVPGHGPWAEAGVNALNVAMSATETITSNPRVLGADPLVEYRPARGVEGEPGYVPEQPGGIGEEVDAFLRYFYVVGDAYLLAYQFFKIFIRIDNYFFHSSLQVFSDYDAYDWSSPAGG